MVAMGLLSDRSVDRAARTLHRAEVDGLKRQRSAVEGIMAALTLTFTEGAQIDFGCSRRDRPLVEGLFDLLVQTTESLAEAHECSVMAVVQHAARNVQEQFDEAQQELES